MKKIILMLLIIIVGAYCNTPLRAQEAAAPKGEQCSPLQLDLDRCINIALQNNNSVKKAEYKVQENIYNVGIVKSAIYPQLTFTPTYIRNEPVNQLIFSGASVQVGEINNYDMNLKLSQLVYTFGRIENSVAAARLGVESAKLDKERTTQQLILDVKAAYYNVLRAKVYVKVAQDSVKSNNDHLKTSRDFFEHGVVAKYDVLRMETKLSEAQQALIVAKNFVNLAENNLKNIMNIDLNTPVKINLPQNPEDILEYITGLKDESDFVKCGILNRPEAQHTKVAMDIARKAVAIAYCADNPNLSLLYNYDWKNPTNFSQKEAWSLAAALSIPVFDGMSTINKVRMSQEVLKQTEATSQDIINNIILEIKQSYLNFNENKARLDTAAKTVAQAEEALSIAEVRYASGISTATELADTQLACDTARVQYLNTAYEYTLTLAKIEKAVGGKQYLEGLLIR